MHLGAPSVNVPSEVKIGQEVTEELDCEPARFWVNRYLRPKYIWQPPAGSPPVDEPPIWIGELSFRAIEKGRPGYGLLALILVNKLADHLPLYRQRITFLRRGKPRDWQALAVSISSTNSPVLGYHLCKWTRMRLSRTGLMPVGSMIVINAVNSLKSALSRMQAHGAWLNAKLLKQTLSLAGEE